MPLTLDPRSQLAKNFREGMDLTDIMPGPMGMVGKLPKGWLREKFSEYTSKIHPRVKGVFQGRLDPAMSLRDLRKAEEFLIKETASGGKITTKKQAKKSLEKASKQF